MKTYKIHLIRHGITQGNLDGKYIGSTDLPLCEQGKNELLKLRETYVYPQADAFFSSPMTRCIESLDILYPGAKPIVIHEMRECDFGVFEGMRAKELVDSEQFREWISSDESFAPPGGESGELFTKRVFSGFEALVNGMLKASVSSGVVMTHGGVIGAVLSRYGLPKAQPHEWRCDPGFGYTVTVHPRLWMTDCMFEVSATLPYDKTIDEIDTY